MRPLTDRFLRPEDFDDGEELQLYDHSLSDPTPKASVAALCAIIAGGAIIGGVTGWVGGWW